MNIVEKIIDEEVKEKWNLPAKGIIATKSVLLS